MASVALITGGQQGIGLGTTECLVSRGFHVALASHSATDNPTVRQALKHLARVDAIFGAVVILATIRLN